MTLARQAATVLAAVVAGALLAGCEPPPVNAVQRGYRGTGMAEVYRPAALAAAAAVNTPPPAPTPASPDGPRASEIFKNVKVLGHLSAGEFTQTMVDITAWVAPQQGCTYCHIATDFADDSLYTKVVSRRMYQMTQHLNADWKQHVANTGVSCYTCHRGNNVPANIWFRSGEPAQAAGMLGNKAGQNAPATLVGLASLPNDPFSTYLQKADAEDIRVVARQALPDGSKPSLIKATEQTYGLMMHMSTSLGVNCTYCHNTRSFASWDMSTPQRATAYYGIRMVRDLNNNYLGSLEGVFPANRLGPTGDVPKLNCTTCHQGAYKPLYGADIVTGHPGMRAGVAATLSGAAGATPATATTAEGAIFYFAVGSAVLAGDAATGVAALAEKMKASPDAKVTISGYHSAAGTLDQNQELAKQRAMAVREALKTAGIAEGRVVLEKPQQTEANVAGEDPKARRVEVAVR